MNKELELKKLEMKFRKKKDQAYDDFVNTLSAFMARNNDYQAEMQDISKEYSEIKKEETPEKKEKVEVVEAEKVEESK